MTHAPRITTLALALFFACGSGVTATAQARQTRPAREANSQEAKSKEAKARAERTRRKAVAVLNEVAAGAREIEDAYRRAAVLAVCADALWEADEQAARSAFKSAWAAAVASDEEEFKEEQEQGRYGDLPERFTRARSLVLAAVARRDTRLSETWLGALADWLARHESSARVEENAEGGGAGPDIGPLNEFTRDGQRLALASSLLDDEEYAAAARLVAPSLKGGVSGALVEFLLNLREGVPDEADRLYLQLLASTRANPGSDANDVLLLSSYIAAPRLLAVVNNDGSLRFRTVGGAGDLIPPAPSAEVRAVFYDTAAAVLLRPAQGSAPGREPHATYFVIGRLLPLFELEASRYAHGLRTRMTELAAQLDLERRAALDAQMGTLRLSPKNPTDPLQHLLDEAKRSDDTGLRDSARMSAVATAAKKRLWERARSLAAEIEDSERRREARALIATYQLAAVREAFEGDENDFESAAALARDAEVSPALRAYGLAVAAEFASKRGLRERAEILLGEAFAQAAQAQAGTSVRAAAAMLTATVASRIASPRAWEALAAAVASLNEDEQFDGEPIWFNMETRVNFSRGEAEALNEALQPCTVDALFDAAALRDFNRAAAEARRLKSPSARSRALIAAARAELAKAGRAPTQSRPAR
jgi:hypothetical protein